VVPPYELRQLSKSDGSTDFGRILMNLAENLAIRRPSEPRTHRRKSCSGNDQILCGNVQSTQWIYQAANRLRRAFCTERSAPSVLHRAFCTERLPWFDSGTIPADAWENIRLRKKRLSQKWRIAGSGGRNTTESEQSQAYPRTTESTRRARPSQCPGERTIPRCLSHSSISRSCNDMSPKSASLRPRCEIWERRVL
jgi:hypothetical protein